MPQTIPFTCRWSDSGVGSAWVHVAGDLDLATSSQFDATLREAQLRATTVVLDLRALSLLGSSGRHAIADAAARARQDDRRLMVVRGAPHVDSSLTQIDGAGELEIFDLERGARGLAPVWAEA